MCRKGGKYWIIFSYLWYSKFSEWNFLILSHFSLTVDLGDFRLSVALASSVGAGRFPPRRAQCSIPFLSPRNLLQLCPGRRGSPGRLHLESSSPLAPQVPLLDSGLLSCPRLPQESPTTSPCGCRQHPAPALPPLLLLQTGPAHWVREGTSLMYTAPPGMGKQAAPSDHKWLFSATKTCQHVHSHIWLQK